MAAFWIKRFPILFALCPLALAADAMPLDDVYDFISASDDEDALFGPAGGKKAKKKEEKKVASSSPIRKEETPFLHFHSFLRHIEGGGIGYGQGYTTVETLFGFGKNPTKSLFLDARLHALNSLNLAGNIGVGYRSKPWEDNSLIFGINTYYDLRFADGGLVNQASLGLELFSNIFDLRLNGYFPFLHTKHLLGYTTDNFSGHYLLLNKKQKLALYGGDAEIGKRIFCLDHCSLYLAAGSYYLQKSTAKTNFGTKARLSLDLFQRLSFDASISNDPLFGTKLQGQMAIHFPFGPSAIKNEKKLSYCEGWMSFYAPPVRNEIIPLKTKTFQVIAKDNNGNPYYFIHVDNTFNDGDGTYESPYRTIAEATNVATSPDIIYLNFGSGDAYEEGLALTGTQMLLGSGATFSIPSNQYGQIVVPALSPGFYPLIVNSSAGSYGGAGIAVTASSKDININAVIVSKCAGGGIVADPGSYTLNITNSQFIDNTSYLEFDNSFTSMNGCIVTMDPNLNAHAILFRNSFDLINTTVSGTNSTTLSTILVDPLAATTSFNVTSSVIYNHNHYGLSINPSGALASYTISNSTVESSTFSGQGNSNTRSIYLGPGSTATTYSNLNILDNILTQYNYGIYVDAGVSSASGVINGNVFNGATTLSTDIFPTTGGGLTVESNASSTAF